MGKMIHKKLSGEIIGIAMEVLNEFKPGSMKFYERAMTIEWRSRGHDVEAQKTFPVFTEPNYR